MGAPNSVQLVIQGAIIALGMALRTAPWARLKPLFARGGAPTGAAPAVATALPDVGDGTDR